MNKRNKVFVLITTIISLIFMLIGATFSYFTANSRSNLDSVAATAGRINMGLVVSPLYTGLPLIPMNDSDLDTALAQNCVDDLGNGACTAYNIEIVNFDSGTELEGLIDFTIDGIENLSYMVLDENGNHYTNVNHIDSSNSTNLTFGPAITMAKGTTDTPVTKTFTLVVWLSEIGTGQDNVDSEGTFSAVVNFNSTTSGRLTASVANIGV